MMRRLYSGFAYIVKKQGHTRQMASGNEEWGHKCGQLQMWSDQVQMWPRSGQPSYQANSPLISTAGKNSVHKLTLRMKRILSENRAGLALEICPHAAAGSPKLGPTPHSTHLSTTSPHTQNCSPSLPQCCNMPPPH